MLSGLRVPARERPPPSSPFQTVTTRTPESGWTRRSSFARAALPGLRLSRSSLPNLSPYPPARHSKEKSPRVEECDVNSRAVASNTRTPWNRELPTGDGSASRGADGCARFVGRAHHLEMGRRSPLQECPDSETVLRCRVK